MGYSAHTDEEDGSTVNMPAFDASINNNVNMDNNHHSNGAEGPGTEQLGTATAPFEKAVIVEPDVRGEGDKSPSAHLRTVGIFRLSAILFFMGYGGSYGVEGTIAYGPPGYVLLAFLIAPFVWALPEVMVTAELSAALPRVGGNTLWSRRAFGKFLAWQSGFYALLSIPSAVATAPVLFSGAFASVLQTSLSTAWTAVIHLVLVVAISFINILGVKSVGGGNIVFSIIVIMPFLLLILVGFAKGTLNGSVITSTHWQGDLVWQTITTSAIWSCGGWTNGGQVAGEISNPKRSFNFAIILDLALTLVFSLIPLALAYCVVPNQAAWSQFVVGSWIDVAYKLGGEWLRFLMAFGAMFSALGEMNSSFCAQARQLQYLSLCEDFSFPPFFGVVSKRFNNSPYVAIITVGIVSFVFSLLPFQTIVQFVVFLASVTLIISYACLIKLRISEPNLDRSFKVPLGYFGLGYICIVGVGISLFNIAVATQIAQITGAAIIGAGIVIYGICNHTPVPDYVAVGWHTFIHFWNNHFPCWPVTKKSQPTTEEIDLQTSSISLYKPDSGGDYVTTR